MVPSVVNGSDPNPTYLWTSVIAGSFDDATLLAPIFTPSATGTNATNFLLTVSTIDTADVTDTASLDSQAAATPPTADAGGPYVGTVNAPIQLAATIGIGTDPSPTFLWTSVIAGTFNDATLEDPIFTPSAVGLDANNFLLTVSTTDSADVTSTASLDSQAGLTFSNVIMTTFTTAFKRVSITLVNRDGSPSANLTGLNWSFFDEATAQTITTAVDQNNNGTTDANGVIILNVPNSALIIGQIGWVIITDSTGAVVDPPTHNAFTGPAIII